VASTPESEQPGVRELKTSTKIVVQEDIEKMRAPASMANSPESHATVHDDHTAEDQKSDYSRHPEVKTDDQEQVRTQLGRKVAGHGPVSEEMISPDEAQGTELSAQRKISGNSELKIHDVSHSKRFKRKKGASVDEEKKRIMDEISKIRLD
jgi:hypothetical protein